MTYCPCWGIESCRVHSATGDAIQFARPERPTLSRARLRRVVLRCTKRLLALLGSEAVTLTDLPPADDDWYGNLQEGTADMPDGRLGELLYRRWLDDPQLELSGLTPRQAASHPEHRATLERLLRSIEHGSARERRDGKPGPEVRWVRSELGLDTPLAA